MRYAAVAVISTLVNCLLIAAIVWALSGSQRAAIGTVFLLAFPVLYIVDWQLQRLGVRNDWKPPSYGP